MKADPRGVIIHASGRMSFGAPGAALVLLLLVVWADLDQTLFAHFNDLSGYTGPAFWAHVTLMGDGLVCAVLLLPWLRRNPERVWGGLLGALFMVLVLRFFKDFMSLPRPLAVLPEDAITVIGPGHRRGSFPSGHTATGALYFGIWALTTRRRLLPWLLTAIAVLVGVSRMAVGVHWPSDVLAGLGLGWISAWLGLRWAGRTPWGTARAARRVTAIALMIAGLVLFAVYDSGYADAVVFQRALALICLAWGSVDLGRDTARPDKLWESPDPPPVDE